MEHTPMVVLALIVLLVLGTSGAGAALAMDYAWVRRHADRPRSGPGHS
jgi:hypothetical protein